MKKNVIVSLWVLAVLWAIELIDAILPVNLDQFGIVPRSVSGLFGIIFSPFLHGGWGHLISNSIPLLILLTVIMTFYNKLWYKVVLFSAIIGGLGVWIIGDSNSVHIGVSGVIFSLMTFLLASGIFRKSFKSIIIGIVIFFLYGGTLLFGILPGQEGVSWEGHLFGAIAGVILAWAYKAYREIEKEDISEEY